MDPRPVRRGRPCVHQRGKDRRSRSGYAEHVAGTIPFCNKLTWLADAGASLPVRESVSLGVDVKWTYYTARIHTTPDDPFQHLELNPLSVSLGLRFRM